MVIMLGSELGFDLDLGLYMQQQIKGSKDFDSNPGYLSHTSTKLPKCKNVHM